LCGIQTGEGKAERARNDGVKKKQGRNREKLKG
jgi:hypothetical protein